MLVSRFYYLTVESTYIYILYTHIHIICLYNIFYIYDMRARLIAQSTAVKRQMYRCTEVLFIYIIIRHSYNITYICIIIHTYMYI